MHAPSGHCGQYSSKGALRVLSRAIPCTYFVASWRHMRAVAIPGAFARLCEMTVRWFVSLSRRQRLVLHLQCHWECFSGR
eukprot:4386284-Prymnesium_polylepis.1